MTRRYEVLSVVMPRAVALSIAAAMLWLALVAAAAAAGPDETIVIEGTLAPAQLEVDLGTTVTWRNEHPERHRIRSKDGPVEFDSGDLDQGESFSFMFSVEGSYSYYDHRDRDNAAYLGTIIVARSVTASTGPLPLSGGVAIIDKSFRPASFDIATGGTIEWSNDDGEAHTVTSTASAFDSGILGSGALFSHTFVEPGDYLYTCLIHPEMRGTITVSDSVMAAGSGDPQALASEGPVDVGGPDLEAVPDASDAVGMTISVVDRSFQPEAVEAAVGDTLTWSNDDTEGHTVTAVDGSFNSGVLTVGGQFSNTFETIGTFDYFCAIHPEMTGTVTVTDATGVALSP